MTDLPPLALAQGAIAVADTVVTIAATSTGLQRWVDLLTSIASIVIALVLIVIAVSLVPAAWNSRKVYKKVNDLMKKMQDDTKPLVGHANAIADNLNYISAAARSDVEQLRRSIDAAQARLDRAARQTEERIAKFNALLGVVQEEAEQIFIDTASTVRGVKAGARALQEERPEPEWAGEDPTDATLAGRSHRPRRHP